MARSNGRHKAAPAPKFEARRHSTSSFHNPASPLAHRDHYRLPKTLAAAAISTGIIFTAAIPAYAADPASVATSDLAVLGGTHQSKPATTAAQTFSFESSASIDVSRDSASGKAAPKARPVAKVASSTAAQRNITSTGTTASSPDAGVNLGSADYSSNAIVAYGMQFLGVPYVYGGSSPSTGFDCSGFTAYVYGHFGISLPRSSSAQRGAGTVVSHADARPGDLIWMPGHVGIYVGGGKILHAPRPGQSVRVQQLWTSNWTALRVAG